jgi:hypothetical protein
MILGGQASLRGAHHDLARFSISNGWSFTWRIAGLLLGVSVAFWVLANRQWF